MARIHMLPLQYCHGTAVRPYLSALSWLVRSQV